jgi:hypothetical protein
LNYLCLPIWFLVPVEAVTPAAVRAAVAAATTTGGTGMTLITTTRITLAGVATIKPIGFHEF